MTAEWLYYGEYHLAGLRHDGIAVDKVEEAVGVALFVAVDTVKVHHLKQRLVAQAGHGQIVDFGAGSIGEIFDVELEFRFLNLIAAEGVDVFHHQVPHGQIGRIGGALEHFEEEALVGAGDVARELTHLVDLSVVGVLVGHGEDLVGAELALDGDVAQGGVEGVFAA